MKSYDEIIASRLHDQQLSVKCRTAQDVVARLGAMQGQDYDGVKWSIGLRLKILFRPTVI